MKALSRYAALPLALVVVIPAVALAAGSSRVWVTSTCTKEQYKPTGIVLACGDGNTSLSNLTWSSWTTRSARGTGTYSYNTCTPTCLAGKVKSYAVRIALSNPKSCRRQAHKTFTDVKLTYTGKEPSRPVTSFKLFCPI